MKVKNTKRGFTLIELMIVVAIIGILAAIAIPKFAQLVTKSQEAGTKGNLGAIRSALSIYYGDMEGWYPTDTLATSLTSNQKYMTAIPNATIPTNTQNAGHPTVNTVTANGTGVLGDPGGWMYDNNGADPNWGRIVVGCNHSDTKGNVWTSY